MDRLRRGLEEVSYRQLYQPLPFWETLRRFGDPVRRRLVLWWFGLSLVFVPTGMVTRVFEWTGMPLSLGGVDFFITIYIPLLFCTLCVMWLGYAWGAIPAYLSTVGVALLTEMPVHWILVFAFANPVGLAVLSLAYRAIPIRNDLRSLASFMFFVLTAFVSALVGSAGSFIWGYTSAVDFRNLMPIWQGWWLGGFVQAMLFIAPVLMLFGARVERWKARHNLGIAAEGKLARWRLLAIFALVVGAVTGYVLLVRYFSLLQLEEALLVLVFSEPDLYVTIVDAFEGLSLVHWVTLLLIGTTGIFGYQVMLHWTLALRASTRALTRLNRKLTKEVTERKRIARQLTKNAAQLKQANDSKDRFFSIISHDLRSPLASFLGLSRMLTEEFDQLDREALKEDLSLLHTSVEHLYELLDNLLTWSRLQTGGMTHAPAWIDLDALVRRVVQMLEPHAAEKHIHLNVHIPPAQHTWADINMIRSVMINLLSNAIKFTPAGGAVVCSVSRQADQLNIEVRDTGVGMNEAQVGHLFKVDTAFTMLGTANEKGSGLGLILCKEMIGYHGADLNVASSPGVGTTFSFALPARPPDAADKPPAPPHHARPRVRQQSA